MSITNLIDRLDTNTSSFNLIAHAYSTDLLEDHSENIPALYVWPGQEEPGPNRLSTGVSQTIPKPVEIMIVCTHEFLEDLREEIRDAILNYGVNSYGKPIEFAGGRAEQITSDYIWWHDTYVYTVEYRKTD